MTVVLVGMFANTPWIVTLDSSQDSDSTCTLGTFTYMWYICLSQFMYGHITTLSSQRTLGYVYATSNC